WIDVQMRASGASRQTKFYTLAIWSSGDDTVHRATVRGQTDGDGRVNVDTFEAGPGAAELTSYELRLILHREAGVVATPSVALLAAATSRVELPSVPSPLGGLVR